MKLTPGRIVLYRLTAQNVKDITHNIDFRGNAPIIGDVVPAIIVRPWSDNCFNGQALLDGEGMNLWLSSVTEGPEPGQFQWPVIDKAESTRPTPLKYTVRYSRLFNEGNFENEKIEIERTFTEDIDSVTALKNLKDEVIGIRQRVKIQEDQMRRYQSLKADLRGADLVFEIHKSEMSKLEKELGIEPAQVQEKPNINKDSIPF